MQNERPSFLNPSHHRDYACFGGSTGDKKDGLPGSVERVFSRVRAEKRR
jgi:hypothetical protein